MLTYKTDGICAKEIKYEIIDGRVRNVQFIGGCPGNLTALGILLEGMPVQDVIAKLKGNQCRNGTSCADQFTKALASAQE